MVKQYPIDPETGLAYEPELGERKRSLAVAERTLTIFRLAAEGHRPRAIADLTGIPVRTVQRYLRERRESRI